MSFAAKPPSSLPRFVPTLTDVVHEPEVLPSDAPAPVAPAPVVPEGMEEAIVHRVMQRVDMALDQRLREAIALVVQEQTRSLLPRLREEVESVLRQTVYEAVAEELAEGSAKI
ncbi:hypothetical protein [Extensimonas sp. H3M7-6]|uniref:hypothetical protein n=1 Tax=Extensimonas soli TaxID=3031322 RepID=UPI0023D9954F|nr:hypothetical protein [Extensimonas sp. H3M7-6]MDF1483122.1 hypothetical protein [Extensimonas sp. H3M7-6]HMM73302.1 hypothetical protein [Rhodocyclaceae bacterium]